MRLSAAANVQIRDSATAPAPELDVLAGLQAEPSPRNDPMPTLAIYDAGGRQLPIASNAAVVAGFNPVHAGYSFPLFHVPPKIFRHLGRNKRPRAMPDQNGELLAAHWSMVA